VPTSVATATPWRTSLERALHCRRPQLWRGLARPRTSRRPSPLHRRPLSYAAVAAHSIADSAFPTPAAPSLAAPSPTSPPWPTRLPRPNIVLPQPTPLPALVLPDSVSRATRRAQVPSHSLRRRTVSPGSRPWLPNHSPTDRQHHLGSHGARCRLHAGRCHRHHPGRCNRLSRMSMHRFPRLRAGTCYGSGLDHSAGHCSASSPRPRQFAPLLCQPRGGGGVPSSPTPPDSTPTPSTRSTPKPLGFTTYSPSCPSCWTRRPPTTLAGALRWSSPFGGSPSLTTSSTIPSPRCLHHGSRWTAWSYRGSTTPSPSSCRTSSVTSRTPLVGLDSLSRASSSGIGRLGRSTSMPSSTCSLRWTSPWANTAAR
jgi:hypothetical protein